MKRSEEPAPNANILIGWCIADRYELEKLVGRGPNSLVFRARDLTGGAMVAVKLLFDKTHSDAETAAALRASRVGHAGIGRVVEVGRTEEDIPYLVTELIEGRAVAELPLDGDRALEVVIAAARAVGAAHAAGIVHGNIKASNVFVTGNDVKVVDFGRREHGRVRASRAGSTRLRAMLKVVAEWNAEQSSVGVQSASGGSSPIDAREDVRALSLLLLDLMTPAASPGDSVVQRTDALERVPRRAAVARLIRRASCQAIEQRPASAAQLADELEQASVAAIEPAYVERSEQSCVAVDSLIGRVVGGRYLIEEVIGRGATSVVFRARHLELGASVAIKVLSPAATGLDSAVHDRFRFEAQVLAGLRHPNIVSVLDLGTTDEGMRYIAMELLQGATLASLIERQKRLAPELALSIVCQTAEALAQLHERGLIHRDVKPANIFVIEDSTRQAVAKLMDFGLARAQDGADDAGSQTFPRREQPTQRGIILGTGAYMSPELIQSGRLDARSDVYALAVVAYRLLTGVLPFNGKTLGQLLSLHLSAPVEPLRQRAPDAAISADVERVILRALAKSPAERPANTRQFAQELVAASSAKPSRAVTAPLPIPAISVRSSTLRMDVATPRTFEVVVRQPRSSEALTDRAAAERDHASSAGQAKGEVDSVGAVSVRCAGGDRAGNQPITADRLLAAVPASWSRRQRFSRMTAFSVILTAAILAAYAMLVHPAPEAALEVRVPGSNTGSESRAAVRPPPAPTFAPAPEPASSTATEAKPSAERSAARSVESNARLPTRRATAGKHKSSENADELKTPRWH